MRAVLSAVFGLVLAACQTTGAGEGSGFAKAQVSCDDWKAVRPAALSIIAPDNFRPGTAERRECGGGAWQERAQFKNSDAQIQVLADHRDGHRYPRTPSRSQFFDAVGTSPFGLDGKSSSDFRHEVRGDLSLGLIHIETPTEHGLLCGMAYRAVAPGGKGQTTAALRFHFCTGGDTPIDKGVEVLRQFRVSASSEA